MAIIILIIVALITAFLEYSALSVLKNESRNTQFLYVVINENSTECLVLGIYRSRSSSWGGILFLAFTAKHSHVLVLSFSTC